MYSKARNYGNCSLMQTDGLFVFVSYKKGPIKIAYCAVLMFSPVIFTMILSVLERHLSNKVFFLLNIENALCCR